jgi:glutamate-1-semialdehyde 2,1-aminomutase
VKSAIDDGGMSTLNCWEEVELAKRLIEIHPWSEMARFSRTGGEACTVAIRIARAATGKDKVLFCGYHGWHDWYLSANLSDGGHLDSQLIQGLEPNGVPRHLKGTAIPFHYGNVAEIEELLATHGQDVGVIIMEPVRSKVDIPFLKRVRELATEYGCVLIYDEITSGFRLNLGGSHLTYGVSPDMAVFGKALGNGYPISAVLGKRSVMDHAQSSFISSTLWTERVGYTAALATLKKMEENNVQEKIVTYGEKITAGWKQIASEVGLNVTVSGLAPLTHIHFDDADARVMQTVYTQEMLKRGYLVGGSVYVTYAYTEERIDAFLSESKAVFQIMKDNLDHIESVLEGPVKHAGFQRLN